ncbi:hypothetical protein V8J88_03585 [Massilia sp. W12]|uniref:hypothetical protein n=1 Tax=Massilia sp. W12 TaxID=3126507 RepID=UPI0030CFDCB0
MKILSTLLVFAMSLCAPASAQHNIQAAALHGMWHINVAQQGVSMASVVHLKEDQTFTSSTRANGAPVLDAAGTWRVDGNKLIWRYERSSHPSITPGFVDSDEILAADQKILRLKSSLSGKTRDWQRLH